MTRTEYKSARIKATKEYISQVEKELNTPGRTATQRANALRHKARAQQRLKVWQSKGFWNSETELAYTMIYSQLPAETPALEL